MPEAVRRVYWDACAWIGFINMEAAKLSSLRTIWEEARGGKYEIWTSTYSYVEVIKLRTENGCQVLVEDSIPLIEAMLEQPHVQRVQLDGPVARLARDLRYRYESDGLDNRPDAIHLATAVHHNLDELHTWDKSHLLPLNGKVDRRDGKPLPIIKPGGAHAIGPLYRNLPGDDLGPRPSPQPGAEP